MQTSLAIPTFLAIDYIPYFLGHQVYNSLEKYKYPIVESDW